MLMSVLISIADWLLLVTVGLSLVAVGVYGTIAQGWHEREDAATTRYHRSCDKMFCEWVEDE
jgi:hypothetical protein